MIGADPTSFHPPVRYYGAFSTWRSTMGVGVGARTGRRSLLLCLNRAVLWCLLDLAASLVKQFHRGSSGSLGTPSLPLP